jgi:uncharacterized protein (DUF697 family)
MAEELTVTESEVIKESGSKVIRSHVLVSMGVGLIPVPLLDMVGITGVQLNMLRNLAKIYEVPITEHKLKSLLATLVGGGGSIPVAGVLTSLVKVIPVVGQTIGTVSMPITAGAITYAVGKVFLQHFASGGTFLSFDPDKVKDYYEEMLEKGKSVASSLK